MKLKKSVLAIILSLSFIFYMAGQVKAISVYSDSPAQLLTPTNIATLTATPTHTETPTFTPVPSNTPTPTIVPTPIIIFQQREYVSADLLLQTLITGAVIGIVFAFLTRVFALKSMSMQLKKLGIALGIEGYEPSKTGVSFNDVKDSTIGDVAGGNIDKSTYYADKSTYYAPTTLRQEVTNISEKLEKTVGDVNRKLGEISEIEGKGIAENLQDLMEHYKKETDENKQFQTQFDKKVQGVYQALDKLSADIKATIEKGENRQKEIEEINNKIDSLSADVNKTKERDLKRKRKVFPKKRLNRNV
jgi:peptidoglycan hydrolase CwlO-like protein